MLGFPYTLPQIAQIVHARDLFQGYEAQVPLHYVAFDTRNIHQGGETLFLALKTAHRNGHDFIEKAWEKGVRNFLVSEIPSRTDINYCVVEDVLDALQVWAAYHRLLFSYPVIGITGSNGKTIVKEWLTTLLEGEMQVVKSPMSYNSQLGVPLSLLQLHPQAQVAIIEAGISQAGEMALLAEMIQPTIGILTHMGAAHQEGFSSLQQKIEEKMLLFQGVDCLMYSGEQAVVNPIVEACFPIEKRLNFAIFKEKNGARSDIADEHQYPFLKTAADRENAALAILAATHIGVGWEALKSRLPLLYPVQMRMEMIADNPEITLINDAYNSDLDSIQNGLELLKNNLSQPLKKLILTDILHQGKNTEQLHLQILQQAVRLLGAENIYTIGNTFFQLQIAQNILPPHHAFLNTELFVKEFHYADFKNSAVLLKGARAFKLEKLIPLFRQRLNATVFKINLNHLAHNLRYFRQKLPRHTKMMCMVKACSYGSGTWEIAEALQNEGVDFLAVAYTSEGVELRERGIYLPIMVMNPDTESLEVLIQYDLQPEIYDFGLWELYVRAARMGGLTKYPVHLKFDTGMGRLGFSAHQLPDILQFLQQYPDIQVMSIMTHLAAADSPIHDAFTVAQLTTFQQISAYFRDTIGISPLTHCLNSAGILRFPEYAGDMVRLGIGLYGVNPIDTPQGLREIGTLQTSISQIHEYPTGVSVGYGRAQFTTRPSRIATIPIGYADGIFRMVGNGKAHFYIQNQAVPTFGRVCMDMMMLDVTDLPEAKVGDTVVIFGWSDTHIHSVYALAKSADTIPYEILTRISNRVMRVYEKE